MVADDTSPSIAPPHQNPIGLLLNRPDMVGLGSENLVVNQIYSYQGIVVPQAGRDPVADPSVPTPGVEIDQVYTRSTPPVEGWVSPEEVGGPANLRDTILKFSFDHPQTFNRIAFEFKNVPMNWSIWIMDIDSNTMRKLTDIHGNEVSGFLTGTRQEVSPVATQASTSIVGNYETYEYMLPPITTSRVEFHFDRRVEPSLLPTYMNSDIAVTYSVSVRNVSFDYVVIRRDENINDAVILENEDVFITNPLGYVEQMTVYDWDGSKVIDGKDYTYWQSEPQPVGDAVVPLYMDIRDVDGNAQLIDRLYLDPIYPGPNMSIYWSNDEENPPQFSLSHAEQTPTIYGNVGIEDDAGLNANANSKALVFDNTNMRLDLRKDWTVGVIYRPSYASTVAGSIKRWIWEFKAGSSKLGLAYDPVDDKFKLMSNETTELAVGPAMSFSADDSLVLVTGVVWSGDERGYHFTTHKDDGTTPQHVSSVATGGELDEYDDVDLTYDEAGFVYETPQTVNLVGFMPHDLTVGSNADRDEVALGYLHHMWIRQDAYFYPVVKAFTSTRNDFFDGVVPTKMDRINGHFGTVFKAKFFEVEKYTARTGPSANYYELKTWTPIPVDYSLLKGLIYLPPTKCKFLKLEFTNLVPRPYPLWEAGIKRIIREFPQWIHAYFAQSQITTSTSMIFDASQITTPLIWEPPVALPGAPVLTTEVWRIPEVSGFKWLPGWGNQPGEPPGEPGVFYDIWINTISSPGAAIYEPGYFHDLYNITDFTPEIETTTIIERSALHKKFFRTVRHEYSIREVNVVEKVAFFVGLRELRVIRVDYTIGDDTPEYIETFGDSKIIDSNTLTYDAEREAMISTAALQQVVTKRLDSLSKFRTVQLAVQAAHWESPMSESQMSFLSDDHITDLANTTRTDVTGQYVGSGAGYVLQFAATAAGTYGVQTNRGVFAVGGEPADTYDSNEAPPVEEWERFDSVRSYDDVVRLVAGPIRTSVMIRVMCPVTNLGTYEVRLYQQANLVAKKTFKPPLRAWNEVELGHLTGPDESDFWVEVIQTNTGVSEPFLLDFLGIFQNPVRWEVSNDDGTTWHNVAFSINDPQGFITLPAADKRLKVRATALRAGAILSGFTLVPWYIESPLVRRIPIDFEPPWGESEIGDLRATPRKPMFALWSHLFPQQFSLNQLGNVPPVGQGFAP